MTSIGGSVCVDPLPSKPPISDRFIVYGVEAVAPPGPHIIKGGSVEVAVRTPRLSALRAQRRPFPTSAFYNSARHLDSSRLGRSRHPDGRSTTRSKPKRTAPERGSFLLINRIITGVAPGNVLIDAREKHKAPLPRCGGVDQRRRDVEEIV
jgi:hypothetical protein